MGGQWLVFGSSWPRMWPPSHGGHKHIHAVSGLMWATRQCVNKYPFSGVTVCGCTWGREISTGVGHCWQLDHTTSHWYDILCTASMWVGWFGMLYSSCNTTKEINSANKVQISTTVTFMKSPGKLCTPQLFIRNVCS